MDLDMRLSANFKLREFLHPESPPPPEPVIKNLKQLAQHLEKVRELLGNRPLTITSGYRTPAHNKAVGGAPKSYHLLGKAADFVVKGMSSEVARQIIDPHWLGGMELGTPHVHLDMRQKKERFYP
jgi:zinc D-Ala-D-Ala carboxypeptidase